LKKKKSGAKGTDLWLLAYKFVETTLSQSEVLIAVTEVEEVDNGCTVHVAVTLSQHLNIFYLVSLIVWYGVLFQINVVGKHLPSQNCYSETHQ
jgi:hypothetical protein